MEEHRHAGLDIYLITQSPNYIHSHLFDLASPHYYVERALNLPQANVFKYNKAQKSPQSSSIKAKADDQFFISLGKKYGQYYKSSAEHNMKAQLPKKLKWAIGILFVLIAWTINSWNKAGWQVGTNRQADEVQTANTDDEFLDSVKEQTELKTLQEKRALEQHNRRIYLIDKQLPTDYEVIKSEPALQVRGVMKMGTTCSAYNTYGDLMILTLQECEYYLNQVGRVHKASHKETVDNPKSQSNTQIKPKEQI